MAYNILYIEDLVADSLKSDIEHLGISIKEYKPQEFNETVKEILKPEYDLILFDFKLDQRPGQLPDPNILFNAPTLAQAIRSKNIDDKDFKPLFLI